MIRIDRERRVVRRLVNIGRRRPLVVTLEPDGLSVREYRRRESYFVTWGAVFDLGAKLAAPSPSPRRGRGRA